MRALFIVAAFVTISFAGAVNAEPALQHSCIAVGGPFHHVAATVARPEDCCTGRMQCSQFLSTTTVVRPAQEQHT